MFHWLTKNKTLLLLPLAALMFIGWLPWKSRAQRSYFPWSNGSWWVYNSFNTKDKELTIGDKRTCGSDTIIDGQSYFRLTFNDSTGHRNPFFFRWEKKKLYSRKLNSAQEYLFADFALHPGDTYSVDLDTIHFVGTMKCADTTFCFQSQNGYDPESGDGRKIDITFQHTFCLEWFERKTNRSMEFFYRKGIGLVGMKSAQEVIYLTNWKVNR